MVPPSEEHDCDWQSYALFLQRKIDSLAQENEQLAKDQAELLVANENLKHKLGAEKKQRFGKGSEKSKTVSRDKKPELTAQQKAERREKAKRRRKENRASRAKIPIEERSLEVPDDQKVCQRCGQFAEFEEIEGGCKETEILERTISALKRLKYRRQKLRCRCGKTFVEAEAPARVFPESEFGPGFVSSIIVAKTLDSMPFYRQRKALFREGLYLNDNTLGSLFHKAAEKLRPLYEKLESLVKDSWLILADETVLTFLSPNKGEALSPNKKTNRGFVWCFLDPENQRVVFRYDVSRSGKIPEQLLKNTSGILLCDGYSGYNVVVNSYDRERAGCLAHARRKFFDLLESDGDLVSPILDLFKVVYRVEAKVAETPEFLGAVAHLAERKTKSLPALEKIKEYCEQELEGLEPTHRVASAMNYFVNQWAALIKFTEDARIPVDNNFCERTLRIIALLRKNSLFVGNPKSGQRTMVLLSLAQSCVLQGINPLEYFMDVLLRMADPPGDLRELLPENWKPPPKSVVLSPSGKLQKN